METRQQERERLKVMYRGREVLRQMEAQAGVATPAVSSLNKEQVLVAAHTLWKEIYAQGREQLDDHDAVQAAMEQLHAMAMDGNELAARKYMDMAMPDAQLELLLFSGWARHGYRQLCTSHRYAAALMSTKIAPDLLDDIRPPWPVFLVEVPSGLLQITSKTGEPKDVSFGLIRHGAYVDTKTDATKPGWSHMLFARDDGAALWGYNTSAKNLYLGNEPEDALFQDTPFTEGITALDDRSRMLFWRLVFGLCLAMQEPSNIKKTNAAKTEGNHRGCKEPVIRTYIIGRPPAIDCRPSIRKYLAGHRAHGPLTVQTLVCGHFRQQVHGPRNTLRKTIWIEPFWRGPEDAPILAKQKAVEPQVP